MKLMGVELKKSNLLGEGVLWEGHCGDWIFQVRKVRSGGRHYLQARVSQRFTWLDPGPRLHPTLSASEPTLWFQTWDLMQMDPPDDSLQVTLDNWFENELRTLEEKRLERECAVAKFLCR